MVVYLAIKEGGEWKLVQSGRTAAGYVHGTSQDKGDVISLGNELLSNHAMDKDEYAVFIIKKASGGVQAVRSRNSNLGDFQVQAFRQDHQPYRRFVEILIRHPSTATEEVIIGYYVTRSAAEMDAVQIRNRLG